MRYTTRTSFMPSEYAGITHAWNVALSAEKRPLLARPANLLHPLELREMARRPAQA